MDVMKARGEEEPEHNGDHGVVDSLVSQLNGELNPPRSANENTVRYTSTSGQHAKIVFHAEGMLASTANTIEMAVITRCGESLNFQ